MLSSIKYKKGDRILVKMDKEYYLGTVSKTSGSKIYIIFDNGNKDNYSSRSKFLVGLGVKKKNKNPIKKKDVKNFLIREKNAIVPTKINLVKLKKDPPTYSKTLALKQLTTLIKDAKSKYYNSKTGSSLISDEIYDILEDELRDRNPDHPLFKKVGAPPKKVGKVRLPVFMPSLDKIKPGGDIEKWTTKYPGPYVVSNKMDGVSLLAVGKEKWHFYTRGDGVYGQDISHLTPFLKLPKSKPGIVVRCEMEIKNKGFEKIFKNESNPRNSVAGLINRKDIDLAKLKMVHIIGYELIKPILKPSAQFKKLKSMGFKIPVYTTINNINDGYLAKTLENRKTKTGFAIDGLVVTQDKVHKRTKTNPPYSIAFKSFIGEDIGVATVEKVLWEVSKYGLLKPRIKIKTIKLSGVKITYVSGYNARFIIDNKIGPNAILQIIRSGDVIPKVIKVLKPSKPQLPERKYIWNENKVDFILTDKKGQDTMLVKQINTFFRVIGLENISLGIMTKLYEDGLDSVPKILNAGKKRLMGVQGIQEKTASTIYEGTRTALNGIELPKLMFASTCFGSLLGLRRLTLICEKIPGVLEKSDLNTKIIQIPGFSEKNTQAFVTGLPKFKKFFKSIENHITLTKHKKIKNSNIFNGQVIVFTGFRSKETEDKIVENGGVIRSGVSVKTTILLVKNLDSTSGKIKKAKELGIRIMTLDKFVKVFGL